MMMSERTDCIFPMGSDCVIVRSTLPINELLGATLVIMLQERSTYWANKMLMERESEDE